MVNKFFTNTIRKFNGERIVFATKKTRTIGQLYTTTTTTTPTSTNKTKLSIFILHCIQKLIQDLS